MVSPRFGEQEKFLLALSPKFGERKNTYRHARKPLASHKILVSTLSHCLFRFLSASMRSKMKSKRVKPHKLEPP